MIQPFEISVDPDALDDLRRRLAAFRSPPSQEHRGWNDGVDLGYLAELVDYWLHQFNWRVQETALNRHEQFIADVRGTKCHFVHERGRGASPLPLLLVHGWPDGFQRFDKLIPLLTDPGAHGGDAADAFDVVVPSLPGCGFSPRGSDGPSLDAFGAVFHSLMRDVLHYDRYGAHGGDVGAIVCDQLCRGHDATLAGVHFTNVPATRDGTEFDDLSAAERDFLARRQEFLKLGGGYMHIQGTKPWTPAVALNDSPAGLAAWIVEKMQAWSDCDGDIERRFTKEAILTSVMLYWITQSIGTSFLGYRDLAKPRHESSNATDANRSRGAAAGFAMFPKDIANAPREWAERFYDVRHWSEMPSGGHFAAWEEPALLAQDIRTFFRPLR
ncbi:epoxide hydrolase family protein [Lichenicoccus sp.]|uniref:epoxide hydrolase family protein n=1 Tax=Lichenicoccus sp. TaxID=2781899 RepID=UPI003D0A8E36